MSKELITRDDLDGSMPAQTVRLGFGDRQMEIDPSEQHTEEFQKAMAPYSEHGRDVEIAPPPPAARRARQARTAP